MLRGVAIAVLLLRLAAAQADPAPLPRADEGGLPLGQYAQFLEDPAGKLSLEEVLQPERSAKFAPVGREVPHFGYPYSAYWLRRALPRDPAGLLAPLLALEVRFPSLDSIEVHVPYLAAGKVQYRAQRAGDQQPWDAREVKHRNFVFRI